MTVNYRETSQNQYVATAVDQHRASPNQGLLVKTWQMHPSGFYH
jgi:hypothetical protein